MYNLSSQKKKRGKMKYKSIHVRNNEYPGISEYLMFESNIQISIQKIQDRIDRADDLNYMHKDEYERISKDIKKLKAGGYYGIYLRWKGGQNERVSK